MTLAVLNNNYTVGRGEVYFAQFAPGTQTPGGEAFFGDCNGASLTMKATQLDHYQSTGGVKTVDQSATIQNDSSGSVMTENISVPNLALFFFGSSQTVTTTSGAVASEVLPPVIPGLYYQLGATASDPVGIRGLDAGTPALVKSNDGVTIYVAGTDYNVDYARGRIYIIPGGAIASASLPKVSYTKLATSRNRVISGQTPIEGAIRFLAANTVGVNQDHYLPWVKVTPNGSFELIGDKYAQMQFDLKILRKGNLPMLFIDGQAV